MLRDSLGSEAVPVLRIVEATAEETCLESIPSSCGFFTDRWRVGCAIEPLVLRLHTSHDFLEIRIGLEVVGVLVTINAAGKRKDEHVDANEHYKLQVQVVLDRMCERR